MEHDRQVMVRTQLAQRGICDAAVLDAMASIPRHLFVPEKLQRHAYEDRALPIPDGQTISQPFIVALMAQTLMLQGTERVLEIGTGSGYAAAVLSRLSAEVYTIERSHELADRAHQLLSELGYHNIHVINADGSNGLPEHGPYGGISVPAASPWVPLPLRRQLNEGGRMVIPVGGRHEQLLLRLTRRQDIVYTEQLGSVRFVPLVGDHAWNN
jgi:protein-L-isoaspartate(D-aspartate) O-methyltransferase